MENNNLIKVGVLGAESTGKTSLCELLAKHYQTVYVPEYARIYFNHSDINTCTIKDLEIIASKQIELEKSIIKQANGILFFDTSLITIKIWAELEFRQSSSIINELLKQEQFDYYLICNNDLAWEKDAQRQNKFSRDLIFEMNLKEAEKSGIPYNIVSGVGEIRLKKSLMILNSRFSL